MGMSHSKDMTQLFRELRQAGFIVGSPTGSNGRRRVTAPNGNWRPMSEQVGDYRAVRNARSWARSNGLESKDQQHKKPAIIVDNTALAMDTAPVVEVVPSPVSVVGSTAEVSVTLPPGHPASPGPGATLVSMGGKVVMEVGHSISPAEATEMLKFNRENRGFSDRFTAAEARDMQEGRWDPSLGDPIRWAVTGKLLDGQTRLQAVVDSGQSFPFVMITGLPESAQDNMDAGRRRTVGHQLKINGVANSNVTASAARLLWEWENDALFRGDMAPSNSELIDYVTTHIGGSVSLELAVSYAQGVRKVIPSLGAAAAVFYLALRADQLAAQEFIEKVATGANLSASSPILALREAAFSRRERRVYTKAAEWLYLIARSWSMWRSGKQTTRILTPRGGITAESIPWIS